MVTQVHGLATHQCRNEHQVEKKPRCDLRDQESGPGWLWLAARVGAIRRSGADTERVRESVIMARGQLAPPPPMVLLLAVSASNLMQSSSTRAIEIDS